MRVIAQARPGLAWHVWVPLLGQFRCGADLDLPNWRRDEARTQPTCRRCLRLLEHRGVK